MPKDIGSTLYYILQMAGALFNLFAGNMVRDLNSNLHAKRKSTDAKRSQSDDKTRKLASVKKS